MPNTIIQGTVNLQVNAPDFGINNILQSGTEKLKLAFD